MTDLKEYGAMGGGSGVSYRSLCDGECEYTFKRIKDGPETLIEVATHSRCIYCWAATVKVTFSELPAEVQQAIQQKREQEGLPPL